MAGRAVLIGVIPLVLLGSAFAAHRAAGETPAPSIDDCSGRMWVRPIAMPGHFWQEHRHRLVGPALFDGFRYVIVNMRTHIAYDWSFLGNRQGRAHFGVPTRWTWFHPRWRDDPWLLAYDCT